MSMIERALSRLGDDATPVRGSVTDLSAYAERPATRTRRSAPSPGLATEPGAHDSPSRRPVRPKTEPAPRVPRPAGSAPTVRLNVAALAERGYVTPDSPATRLSNEFRVIKRPLIANASGRGRTPVPNGHRVMVTSANPDEGKSFCAVNLALSIAAERDLQVLLIDADVARPSLQRELRLPRGPGLMDLLLDPGLPLEATVRETNIDKFAVMTAGTLSDNANELLASDAMGRLLDLISEHYPDRIVIFDAPPLLPTTEGRVLAGLMGQIALVVEAGVTSQGAVEEALAIIEACPVVGVILNKADERRTGGYGYGYGYGYGDRDDRH